MNVSVNVDEVMKPSVLLVCYFGPPNMLMSCCGHLLPTEGRRLSLNDLLHYMDTRFFAFFYLQFSPRVGG